MQKGECGFYHEEHEGHERRRGKRQKVEGKAGKLKIVTGAGNFDVVAQGVRRQQRTLRHQRILRILRHLRIQRIQRYQRHQRNLRHQRCKVLSGDARSRLMNVKFTTGGWGRGTEVQSPRSNVQSRRRPARVHPIPRRAVRCAARGLCTALKRGVNESGVCESCDNCDSFTNLSSREMRRALRRRVSLPESAVVPAQSKVGIARWSNPRDLQSSQDLQCDFFARRRMVCKIEENEGRASGSKRVHYRNFRNFCTSPATCPVAPNAIPCRPCAPTRRTPD